MKENPMKKGVPMPSPNQLKRKILLKHKRLKPDVEKTELELFLKGALEVDDAVEDPSAAAPEKKPDEPGLNCMALQNRSNHI